MNEILVAILRAGTPLVYVTMAGVIAQRAGVWHLGLEGVMIIGCCATVLGIVMLGSFWAAMLVACLLCVAASVLLWFAIEKLRANPIIAGLGLTGLGIGGTALAVQSIYGSQAPLTRRSACRGSGRLSVPTPRCRSSPSLCRSWCWRCGCCSGAPGLGCSSPRRGEHPFAARSVGVEPSRMRLVALAVGGVLCAVGGAELAAGSLQIFAQDMTAGRGFMGFAAVVFGGGHPIGSALAAMFFAVVGAIGIRAQLMFGDAVPHDLLLALPYLATVFGVWVSGRLRGGAKAADGFAELRDY